VTGLWWPRCPPGQPVPLISYGRAGLKSRKRLSHRDAAASQATPLSGLPFLRIVAGDDAGRIVRAHAGLPGSFFLRGAITWREPRS
jgi:hypothetical protein